jgi:hypothetical protein
MRKEQRTLLAFAILVVSAIALALVSAGYTSQSRFQGQQLQQVVDGDFSSDAWIGQRATVVIPGFASILNSVAFSFSPIRVGATEPGMVAVSVCGGPEQSYAIESDAPIRMNIPMGCSPLEYSACSCAR